MYSPRKGAEELAQGQAEALGRRSATLGHNRHNRSKLRRGDGYAREASHGRKSQMDTVRRYIASQAHHRKLTSQEEFLAVPNAHEIEYNERYIWKRMLLPPMNCYLLHLFKFSAPLSPAREREGVKESPPILGGDEARQGFGGGKGRV